MKVIGISGPSCCGKSTLARHLRSVLPNSAILYEDDFYRNESELPLDSAGRANWDCPAAFDLEAMQSRLAEIKRTNQLPDQNTREEHNNNSSSYLLPEDQMKELRDRCKGLIEPILLVDGILLFHEGSEVAKEMDIKILFPFTYSELKARRESRTGYATIDGFWTDPPNYFDELVWPEFVKYSKQLYEFDGQKFTKLSPAALEAGIWMPTETKMGDMLNDVIAKLD